MQLALSRQFLRMTSQVTLNPPHSALCTTCLSSSRTTRVLRGTSLTEAYRAVLPRSIAESEAVCVCWECEAVLHKFAQFRQRAELAYVTLQQLSLHQETELTCLSSLRAGMTKSLEIVHRGDSSHDTDESPPVSSFKTEPELVRIVKKESSDSSDDSRDSENEPLAEVTRKRKATGSSKPAVVDMIEAAVPSAPGVCVRMMKEPAMRARRLEMSREPRYASMPHACAACLVGFRTAEERARHVEAVHTPKPGHMRCSVCEAYVERVLLEVHVRKHYATFACTHCSYTHYSEEQVQWHAEGCTGRAPAAEAAPVAAPPDAKHYPCEQCSKIFKSRAHMKAHVVRQHSGPRACGKCGKVLPTTQALWLHMQMEHKDRDMRPCPVCGKHLPGAFRLKQHMRVHRADPRDATPHRCEPCDKLFMSERAYNIHLTSTARHNTEQELKFKCSACDRAFAFKGALYSHYSHYHKKATMLQCHLCDRVLATSASLKRHSERVHEGVREKKDRMCDVCGKYFGASQLKQHMLIHTEERPYACKVCGATFRQRPALYTHNRLVHLNVRRSRPPAHAPPHGPAF